MYKLFGAVNKVDSHNKSRQAYMTLDKFWVTQCGWIWLYTTVSMGITINNCWKFSIVGLIYYTMKNLLASENSWNDLL